MYTRHFTFNIYLCLTSQESGPNVFLAGTQLLITNPTVSFQAVLHSFQLNSKDFNFGLTRVFFRPGKYAEFDTIMKSDPENLKAIIKSVEKWLVKSRWRQSIFGVISIIKCN